MKRKSKISYDKECNLLIRGAYKKQFKKTISDSEINKIWDSYINEHILPSLKKGDIVKLNDILKIWVKATPINKHKRAMALLNKGLMYVGGRIKEANISVDSSEYIYKILLEADSKSLEKKIFFKPHASLSSTVREGIKSGKLITRLQCQ